ncbi:hypothetical protein BS50DRAFT_667564 [Corynespora cassiicola Philippines]|uniref:Uncharacterized protein n=1 Tax=Corynespora cassiicola Philippines TaxID=1448308 RepID=A0A2T2NP82_CORCC|nr:hypothetical protein BS50DRAFT_667564 [Corynespora cassiicola Philippines]
MTSHDLLLSLIYSLFCTIFWGGRVEGIIWDVIPQNISCPSAQRHYNATTSFPRSGFFGGEYLTYHTGLYQSSHPKGEVGQFFWVDTTGGHDLGNRPGFTSAVQILYNFDSATMERAKNDAVGQQCLGVLSNKTFTHHSTWNNVFEYGNGSSSNDFFKDSGCQSLLTTSAITLPLTWDPEVKFVNCANSTNHNEVGKNPFASLALNQGYSDGADFAKYDLMAGKAFFMRIAQWGVKNGVYVGSHQFICFKNMRWAEGSRIPEGLRDNSSDVAPNTAAVGVRVNGWCWGFVAILTAFALFL